MGCSDVVTDIVNTRSHWTGHPIYMSPGTNHLHMRQVTPKYTKEAVNPECLGMRYPHMSQEPVSPLGAGPSHASPGLVSGGWSYGFPHLCFDSSGPEQPPLPTLRVVQLSCAVNPRVSPSYESLLLHELSFKVYAGSTS